MKTTLPDNVLDALFDDEIILVGRTTYELKPNCDAILRKSYDGCCEDEMEFIDFFKFIAGKEWWVLA